MTRFDASLSELIRSAADYFDKSILDESVIVREAGGRLSLFIPAEIQPDEIVRAELGIREKLGNYARPDKLINDITSPGSKRILLEGKSGSLIRHSELTLRLLDRRIVGADWLRPPRPSASSPRVVFASLKGGVGRTTALCVMAAHLSRRGARVLVVDLDFEAPGLGSMLLTPVELPIFGTIDYLLENGLSGIDDDFVNNVVGSSYLGSSGASVKIVPAIGTATLDNPANALGKISRAYLEDLSNDGKTESLSEQIANMIDDLEKTSSVDVTLIDARAGLHETTAAAILSLGADVLLFGTDQPQTFQGYRLLLAHLANFAVDPRDDWRDRLNFVYAKAQQAKRSDTDQRFRELFRLLDIQNPFSQPPVELSADDLDVEWDDRDLTEVPAFEPQPILYVLEDPRFHDFDPARDPTYLDAPSYSSSFATILDFADGLIMDKDAGL